MPWQRSSFKFAAVFIIAALVVFIHPPVLSETNIKTDRIGILKPIQAPPTSAQQVKVGFRPIAIYDLDQTSNTFYAQTYIWMTWRGKIDPTKSFKLTNLVEEWSKAQESIPEKVKQLPDGSKYQLFRIEGRFSQPLNFADYPLDSHGLKLMIEETANSVNDLAYVIDESSTSLSSVVSIPGWEIKGWRAYPLIHDYESSLGDPSQPSKYSVANYELIINRPAGFFYWQQMLPLTIVVMAALSSLLLASRSIDARVAMALSSLLSAIFLQQGIVNGLPELDYLVFIDKIYLIAYPLILAALVRSILSYLASQGASDTEAQRIHLNDRNSMFILGSVFIVGCLIITAFS